MIVLNSENKTIEFSYSNIIRENLIGEGAYRVVTHTPELPTVTCSNKKDAETIQKMVNTFIHELSHELLEK